MVEQLILGIEEVIQRKLDEVELVMIKESYKFGYGTGKVDGREEANADMRKILIDNPMPTFRFNRRI